MYVYMHVCTHILPYIHSMRANTRDVRTYITFIHTYYVVTGGSITQKHKEQLSGRVGIRCKKLNRRIKGRQVVAMSPGLTIRAAFEDFTKVLVERVTAYDYRSL